MAKNEKPEETNPKTDDEAVEAIKSDEQPEPEAESKEESVEKIEESSQDTKEAKTAPATAPTSKLQKLKTFIGTKKGKIAASVAVIVVIVGVLSLIPATRYAVAGTVLKKDVSIKVVDQTTGKKVTEATVSLAGKSTKTDKEGVAKLSAVPVGEYQLTVEKKYYKKSATPYLVPIFANPSDDVLKITATGRQVTITVANKISKQPLEKATVEFSGTSAITDGKGQATLVLPSNTRPYEGKVTAENFNEQSISLKVEDKDEQQAAFEITPSGTIYFLSKRTGKLNVMKSNLDGTNSQTVVEGTGNEQDGETVLLAARDWDYLALLSRREGDKPKLYSVNTKTSELKIMDEGNAYFELVGWSGKRFVYKVVRNTNADWENKRVALKSYDATSGKLATLDETFGEAGGASWDHRYENISNIYILKDKVVYIKDWSLSWIYQVGGKAQDKTSALMSIAPDGTAKKRVKEFDSGTNASLQAKLYAPEELYIRFSAPVNRLDFYEYEDEKVSKVTDINDDKFYKPYPTYLVSPSGEKTFWYEPRDGKNVLFVGNASGEDKAQLATLSEYVPYGWLTDDYILMSKGGSELYVSSRDRKLDEIAKPLKITDYHKPYYAYAGYGYGYGGQ